MSIPKEALWLGKNQSVIRDRSRLLSHPVNGTKFKSGNIIRIETHPTSYIDMKNSYIFANINIKEHNTDDDDFVVYHSDARLCAFISRLRIFTGANDLLFDIADFNTAVCIKTLHEIKKSWRLSKGMLCGFYDADDFAFMGGGQTDIYELPRFLILPMMCTPLKELIWPSKFTGGLVFELTLDI